MVGTYRTHDAVKKELADDILNFITNKSSTDTPLLSGLDKSSSKASGLFHEWLTDSFTRPTTTSAQAEGMDVTFADVTGPSRKSNYVQEIVAPFKVSFKMQNSNMIGMSDAFDYQSTKAMENWGLKAEFSLVYGTGITGSSGVATEMIGLKKIITTNFVSVTSYSSITAKGLNDALQLSFNSIKERNFELYTGIQIKRGISAFTTSATKYIMADEKRGIDVVDVYESDLGKVRLYPHRDLGINQAWSATTLIINPNAFRVAFQAKPSVQDVAVSGPYKAGYVYGALTLEALDERAGVRIDGYVS